MSSKESDITPKVDSSEDTKIELSTKAEVSYDDWLALDIKIGTVTKCENHPDADRLLVCQIDFGKYGDRQIVSGLRPHYKADDLVGKQFPYILNLPSRSIRGVLSEGMIMAARDDANLALLNPSDKIEPGTSLS